MSLTEPFEVVANLLLPLTNLMEAFLFKVAVSLAAVHPGCVITRAYEASPLTTEPLADKK